VLIFVSSLKIHALLSFKKRDLDYVFLIKEKWLREIPNRKKSMELTKAGGARKSEDKALVTK